jgi:monovalent cation:proton antiporter-2 (CPA2) family protein
MTNYLEQALVFIGSSVILVPIFHRLGFGSIIGYLMAGILVGPSGFKLISDSQSILHFAEFGVVILLFIIGLEIQPRKLWTMKGNLIGLGGAQILISTFIFTLFGFYLGLTTTAAIIVGFGLSLSSTAFALQTLTEKNQFKTEFGQASFSILLMQDLFAIPALAIIPALANNPEQKTDLAVLAIFIPTFLIAAYLANRFLIHPLFKMVAATKAREIFTATTLLIVLGVATIMIRFGLSAALGTFIAGMLLADSEYRHELEANLDPFKSLLMGLFFIAVGMGVRLDLIVDQPLLIFGLALSYLAIKMLVIYGVGRFCKLTHENSKNMALTIAQGGEFAFVIFGMVQDGKYVEPEVINILTMIVTISMALNPLISLISDKLTAVLKTARIEPQYDNISDESPHIIIAGYGRFGQMIGRILKAQDIPFVAVDHDSDQIELLRRFSVKVYYGDASRSDILESAGAAKAKYIVLAIDDMEVNLKTAEMVREHFPQIKIFARARNRGHAFSLMDLGINNFKRETFDSSVHFAGELLLNMGYPRERVSNIVEKFKAHDELMLREQYKVREDDKQFVSISNQSMAQLAQVLNDESSRSYIELPTKPEN